MACLDVSVTNLGQNPVEISSIWIINKTLTDAPATRYDVNFADSFVTGSTPSSILDSQSLQMTPDTYDIKVETTLISYASIVDIGSFGKMSIIETK